MTESVAIFVVFLILIALGVYSADDGSEFPAIYPAAAHGLCTGNISLLEYSALETFYTSTDGPNWRTHGNQTRWVFPSSLSAPCGDGWQGTVCQEQISAGSDGYPSCTIVSLELPLTNLRGTLPPQLVALSSISQLSFEDNSLTGLIPPQLGELFNLTNLSLSGNKLMGPIPSQLGNLTALTQLALDTNSLTGSIPPQLGNLLNLSQLVLHGNKLTGSIPSQLGYLTSLTDLALDSNSLTGTIPHQMGNLLSLSQLALDLNHIRGSIPSQLGQLTSLTELALDSNSLTGTIPSQMGNLLSLSQLALSLNSLSGPIPSQLGGLTSLRILYLDFNCLTGFMPAPLMNLTTLTNLGLNANSLIGSIPSQLGKILSLQVLDLSQNSLTGSIPTQLVEISALVQLNLYQNSLTGTIPIELGNLSSVTTLNLCDNFLTGALPTSLAFIYPRLTEFNFADNSLTGTIPAELSAMINCYGFNISFNAFTGSIPSSLGKIGLAYLPTIKLKFGVQFDISANSLTGTIPEGLFTLQMQTIVLHSNCFQGSLPADICSAQYARALIFDTLSSAEGCGRTSIFGFKSSFAKQFMEGSIPSCVWSLPQLQTLHLSGNGLEGTIGEIAASAASSSSAAISQLSVLDVSNNYLTGSIPMTVQTHTGFQQLALANNKLSGTLSHSFYVSNNTTLLTLAVNRLSGSLPPSIASAPASLSTVNVLSDNLFSCGTDLPCNDPSSTSYVCGSSTLNFSLYLFGSCAVTAIILLGLLWAAFKRRKYAFVSNTVGLLMLWWRQSSEAMAVSATRWQLFVKLMERLRSVVLSLCVLYLALSMPVYGLLKYLGDGELTYQYTWTVTAAFLHSYPPVICVLSFVGISIVAFSAAIFGDLRSFSLSAVKFERVLKGRERRVFFFALQRFLFQFTSLGVVFVVNVAYVYALISNTLSSTEVILLQIAMGTFKLMWKFGYIKRVSVSQIRQHVDLTGADSLFHEVLMNLLNFILIPCIATLGTDGDCLYYAIFGQQTITSTSNVATFTSDTISSPDGQAISYPVPVREEVIVTINPSWLYSYQCSSAVLTNYEPVLLVSFTFGGIIVPVVLCSLLVTSWHREARGIERVAASGCVSPLKYILSRLDKMLDPRGVLMDVLVDMTVLMTFGLASPLLALAIILKQLTMAVYLRLWIGRYLLKAENKVDAMDQLSEVCQCIEGEVRTIALTLTLMVSIFWGGMVFDMIADIYGVTTGVIVAMLSIVFWLTLLCTMHFIQVCNTRKSPISGSGSMVALKEVLLQPRPFSTFQIEDENRSTDVINSPFDNSCTSNIEV